MSWETQVLGYRGCTGRPEHWEARDVLGERSEHWDEGDALGDPFPLRESDLQRHRLSHGAGAAHPTPVRSPHRAWCPSWGRSASPAARPPLGVDKTPRSLFHQQQHPQCPRRWADARHQEARAEPGQARAAGPEPSPARGLPGHAERHIRTTGPGRSAIAPASAPHRGSNPVARTPAGEEIQHLSD